MASEVEFPVTLSRRTSSHCPNLDSPQCNRVKTSLIIFGVLISTLTFVSVLIFVVTKEKSPPIVTPSPIPITDTSSLSTTTKIPDDTTSTLSTTTEEVRRCDIEFCFFGCCWIQLRTCTVRCENCEDLESDDASKRIHYLSETLAGCTEIHLVLSNCATNLRENWLRIPTRIKSLAVLVRLDTLLTGAFTSDIFKATESLLIADLSIDQLDGSLFTGLANLEQLQLLNIEDLNVQTITQHTFATLTKLKNLEISEISYREMHLPNLIGEYRSIKTLSLNKNIISWVHAGILVRLPNLIVLNLIKSHVAVLAAGAFDGLPNLRAINLSHNVLSSLPPGIFANIVERPRANIDLTFNEWFVCDCGLLELQEYLQNPLTQVAFTQPDLLTCMHPRDVCTILIGSEYVCGSETDDTELVVQLS